MAPRPIRILAVASGGGHWVQLLRLRPAFAGAEVTYVTVSAAYRTDLEPGARFFAINDATRWNKLLLLLMAFRLALIFLRVRPDAVVTTGAAPGFFAIKFGRWLGAKTAWIDSIANVEQLSLSGQRAGSAADLWLTQWPHLAREGGPEHRGSVL